MTRETFWQKVHRLKKRGYNEKDAIEKAREKIETFNDKSYKLRICCNLLFLRKSWRMWFFQHLLVHKKDMIVSGDYF